MIRTLEDFYFIDILDLWVIFPKTALKVAWETFVEGWLKITVILPKTALKVAWETSIYREWLRIHGIDIPTILVNADEQPIGQRGKSSILLLQKRTI